MIVSFSVANFRSFAQEQTLSLVASGRLSGSHENHTFSIPGAKEKALKAAVLYGANGAGKSNLFKALEYLQSLALKTRDKHSDTGRQAFRFADAAEPYSLFDLQFIAGQRLYRYGLKLDDRHIAEEWLAVVKNGKETTLYERVTDEHGKVSVNASGLKRAKAKLKALATVGGPPNQSFLATVKAMVDAEDFGAELAEVMDWFESGLVLIAPDASCVILEDLLQSDPDFLNFAGRFLKAAATGIDHLTVEKLEINEEDLRSLLPDGLMDRVKNGLADGADHVEVTPPGQEFSLHIDKDHCHLTRVQSIHEHQAESPMALDLAEESDGTRRLLDLLPALHHLLKHKNAVFFIDEIDRSMHPMLARQFMDFFLNACQDGQHQIIVTTHECNLLDLELLRRDEIWFAEKDSTGASHLYSLADFKIRNDLEIRKHYLQGRFGGIPFLGNLDRLRELAASPQ
jgi:energy-coupling factor transporter ATP-binding protein EcfA2